MKEKAIQYLEKFPSIHSGVVLIGALHEAYGAFQVLRGEMKNLTGKKNKEVKRNASSS